MAYKHNHQLHVNQRRARRARRIFFAVFAIVLIGVSVVVVDWVMANMNDGKTVVTTEQTRSVQSSNISIYRTKYYQFQAVDDWVEVEDDGQHSEISDERFVYVRDNDGLAGQRLTVYVNKKPNYKDVDLKLTRVLPLELGPLGRFINVGRVGDHCLNSWIDPLSRNPIRITHDDVSFVCAPDSAQYNIVVGERGQDEDLTVILDDGTTATLTIIYSDLTAYPSTGDIYNIIDSFTIL